MAFKAAAEAVNEAILRFHDSSRTYRGLAGGVLQPVGVPSTRFLNDIMAKGHQPLFCISHPPLVRLMRISPSSELILSAAPADQPSLNSTPATARAFYELPGRCREAAGNQHLRRTGRIVLVGLSHLVPDIGGSCTSIRGWAA